MTCPEARSILIELLYRELPAGQRPALTAHLDRCRACQGARRELEATVAALDRWTPAVPRDLHARLAAALGLRSGNCL